MHSRFCLILILALFSGTKSYSQTMENGGDYMTQMASARIEMDQQYMAYISAAAHSRKVRKVEKLRAQTLVSIDKARSATIRLPKFKGDNSLREASIDYIQLCYGIFHDDYAKMVNMEESAEQSVDQMQAYLLLEEKTNEKLERASADLDAAEKTFAAKYEVTVVESKNELTDKMYSAGLVNRYCDKVFILFFKANWEDGQLFNALNSHRLHDAEQARVALIRFAEGGLAALTTDSLKDFKGHSGLANGCRQALEFYLLLAKNEIPKLTDFYLKQENFQKLKRNMEAKGSNRTKQEVDEYNKAVRDMNSGIASFNQLNQDLNKQRREVSLNWEEAERGFRDDLIPEYK